MAPWLTKSRFLSGLQCEKRLWYEVHAPLEVNGGDSMQLVNGRAFDQVVQRLEPGLIIPREGGLVAALDETRDALSRGSAPVIYQGAFREGSRAAVVDILRAKNRAFELVEVKASTSVKDEHLPDVGFQALVLEQARIPVARVHIGPVNNRFVLRNSDEYAGLLIKADVTEHVRAMLPAIKKKAAESIEVIGLPSAPDVPMGGHCEVPYPCPFMDRCAGECAEGPKFPLSILPRGGKLVAELASEGYEDLRDVPAERLKSKDHRRVHAATVSGRAAFDVTATAELSNLAPPFAYLDFETMTSVVPEIGTRPYEQCPFQWSLHLEAADGTLSHAEYLAIDNVTDVEALASALLAALPPSGPVFVDNRSLEQGVLQLLARLVPARARELRAVVDRLVDLLPITRAAYYHPDMLGSWSIKKVLPTIDSSLGYDALEVQEGSAAQLVFLELRNPASTSERREELAKGLRTYCERDTYAMVVLRRFLCCQYDSVLVIAS